MTVKRIVASVPTKNVTVARRTYQCHGHRSTRLAFWALCAVLVQQSAGAQDRPRVPSRPPREPAAATVSVPKVEQGPTLDEFLEMQPVRTRVDDLAELREFTQRTPDDGHPATEQTEVYLAYTSRYLFVVFVAHESNPKDIRARLTRREAIAADEDRVGIYIDTFGDGRRAYRFQCNPLGVQDDAMYSEDAETADAGFDTVWQSRGALTDRGFVVWMRIPFKSLRFPHETSHTWSIAAWRTVARRSEESWWPRVSGVTRGILSQAGAATGITHISPGRNVQLIPYASGRGYRSRRPSDASAGNDLRGGLDAKMVIRDSLVLDATVKPDFSQVESDEPVIATNQRYEIFYPERRPFFTENSAYFDVPLIPNQQFIFTRRIANPDAGARLTGKLGDYSVGVLVANDAAPGQTADAPAAAYGRSALFQIVRASRAVADQSNVGGTYAERRFDGSFSRVADLDTTLKIGSTWKATLMGAYNWNRSLDGTTREGRDIETTLTRVSRRFGSSSFYVNRAPGYAPATAYYNHSDWHEFGQTLSYQWWPDRTLTHVYAEAYAGRHLRTNGDLIWEGVGPLVNVDVHHNTTFSGSAYVWRQGVSPLDFPVVTRALLLPATRVYSGAVTSRQLRWLSVKASAEWGARANNVPARGTVPTLLHYQHVDTGAAFVGSSGLRLDNTYLFERARRYDTGEPTSTSHIARTKVSWQLSRELSLRVIGQYELLDANPRLTATPRARKLNADVLLTYLVHPGTAVYLGYNSNFAEQYGVRDNPGLVEDGRQLFVKASYLLRF